MQTSLQAETYISETQTVALKPPPAPVFRKGHKRGPKTPFLRAQRAPQKVSKSEVRTNLKYTELERMVRTAPTAEVLSALKHTPGHCCVNRGYPAGGALWYYMSLVYFGGEAPLPEIGESDGVQEVVAQSLLSDLCTSSLDEITLACEAELERMEPMIHSLMTPSPSTAWTASTDSERVLELVKCRPFSAERNDFLREMEQKRLAKIPDDACGVCGGGESMPPDDWIVLCSGCEIAVHMKCFGLASLPEGDWFCDVCKSKATDISCGICLRSGGLLKPTIHEREWPFLRQSSGKQRMWVHLYCALMMGASFLLGEARSLVDLSGIPMTAWQRVCSYCTQRLGGACSICSLCQTAFHPECWRRVQIPPWLRTSPVCRRHSLHISPENIQFTESCLIKEVMTFCSILCRPDSARIKRKRSISEEFTEDDSLDLLRLVEGFLRGVNSLRNSGFSVTFQPSSGAVKVEMPEAFNALSPEVVKMEELAVAGKSAEECYWQYAAMYPALVERLRRPKVELTMKELRELSCCQRLVTKKRRLVQRRTCESQDTVVRLPLSVVKESEGVSSGSTQDVSEDDTEDPPKV